MANSRSLHAVRRAGTVYFDNSLAAVVNMFEYMTSANFVIGLLVDVAFATTSFMKICTGHISVTSVKPMAKQLECAIITRLRNFHI
jgi:hypothetical protein